METKGFFQFEIFINVLFTFFRFIWIPMVWVYVQYKYLNSFQCGDRVYASESDVQIRQIVTYKDGPRAKRVKHFISRSNHCFVNEVRV